MLGLNIFYYDKHHIKIKLKYLQSVLIEEGFIFCGVSSDILTTASRPNHVQLYRHVRIIENVLRHIRHTEVFMTSLMSDFCIILQILAAACVSLILVFP